MIHINLVGIFFLLLGLSMVFDFRKNGKIGIEQRMKFDKSLHGKYWDQEKEAKKYGRSAILFNQIGLLLMGIIFIIFGLSKLL